MYKRLCFFVEPKFIMISMFFLLAGVFQVQAAQSDLKKELDGYIEIFDGTRFIKQKEAIGTLGWMGISDSRLYDLIEEKLEVTYLLKDKQEGQKAAWYVKALGFSGNEKYRSRIEKTMNKAAVGKVKKHAKIALSRLGRYKTINAKISHNLVDAPEGQLEQARIRNMLSDNSEPLLLIFGARRVYYSYIEDKSLVSMVHNRLEHSYRNITNEAANREWIDAMAWCMKVLVKTGDQRYKPVLENILQEASNKKIKKHAEKFLKRM